MSETEDMASAAYAEAERRYRLEDLRLAFVDGVLHGRRVALDRGDPTNDVEPTAEPFPLTTIPEPPGIRVVAVTSSSISIEMTPSRTESERPGTIAYYESECCVSSTFNEEFWRVHRVVGGGAFAFRDLYTNCDYYVRTRCVNAQKNASAWSMTAAHTSPAPGREYGS